MNNNEMLKKIKKSEKDIVKINEQLGTKANEVDLIVERNRINLLTKIENSETEGNTELLDIRNGVDGIAYATAGESIRRQFSGNIANNVALDYKLTAGGYVHHVSGNIVSHDNNFKYSDYIELLYAGGTLTIKNLKYPNNDAAGLAFYDSNKKFISGYQYNKNNDLTVNIPDNAKYIRFTVAHNNYLTALKIYQGGYKALNAIKTEVRALKEATTKTLDSVKSDINGLKGITKHNWEKIELTTHSNNSYIQSSGGVIGGQPYLISEPISVLAGSRLRVGAKGYKSNVAIISQYLGVTTKYKPLIISKDGLYEYWLEVTEDIQIVICSEATKTWELYINTDLCKTHTKFDIDVDMFKDILKFDLGPITDNCYISYAKGVTVANTTSHLACTDFIDVCGASHIIIKNINYGVKDAAGLAFYDASKQFISGYQYNKDTSVAINVPKSAKYLRFSLLVEFKDKVIMLFNIPKMLNNITSINKVYDVSYQDNAYIHYVSGKIINHNGLSVSDFIELSNLTSILKILNLDYPNKDNAGLAFYDSNKMFISGYQYKDIDLELEIPQDAKYVRATIRTSNKEIVEIYSEGTMNNGLFNLDSEIASVNKKCEQLEEFNYCQIFHKIAGIGDSLMSGELAYYDHEKGTNVYVDIHSYSWLSNLCKNIGATAVHYSSGGRTTKTWLSGFLTKMKSETIKPSAYYIALGTNDSNRGIPLGTIEDCGTDAETYYGMYSKIIREVQAFNPHAKIFCCSLYYNPTSTLSIQFCEAIKNMCKKYGCYYIDFLNKCSHKYDSSMISVGHYTAPGYASVGKDMQMLTNQVIKENLSDFSFVGLHHKDI